MMVVKAKKKMAMDTNAEPQPGSTASTPAWA